MHLTFCPNCALECLFGAPVTTDAFRAFVQALNNDPSLQEAMKARLKESNGPEAILATAREAGFVFTVESIPSDDEQLITDDQLASISGGGAGSQGQGPKGIFGFHCGV